MSFIRIKCLCHLVFWKDTQSILFIYYLFSLIFFLSHYYYYYQIIDIVQIIEYTISTAYIYKIYVDDP